MPTPALPTRVPPAAGRVNPVAADSLGQGPRSGFFSSHGSRPPGLTSDGKTIYLRLAGEARGGGMAVEPAARCGGAPRHPPR